MPFGLGLAEIFVNTRLHLRDGQNHLVAGLVDRGGDFAIGIGHVFCDLSNSLFDAVHYLSPRVGDSLHRLFGGAFELLSGAVIDVVGVVGSLCYTLDAANDVASTSKYLLRGLLDGIGQLFGISGDVLLGWSLGLGFGRGGRSGNRAFAFARRLCRHPAVILVPHHPSVRFIPVLFPLFCCLVSVKCIPVHSIPVATKKRNFAFSKGISNSSQAHKRGLCLVDHTGKSGYLSDKARPSVGFVGFLRGHRHIIKI